MLLNPDVSLKLTLATATILTGCALRVTRVVTRENGESLLAVVFGILLPSLLIQVRDDDVLERRGAWNLGTGILSACAREERARFALVVLLVLLRRRLASLFFFRVSFLSGGQKSSHADPSSVFIRVCVYT
jgi:hypothetical protein